MNSLLIWYNVSIFKEIRVRNRNKRGGNDIKNHFLWVSKKIQIWEKDETKKNVTILFVYEKNYNLCSRLRVASNKFVQVNWDLIIEPLNEIHIIPFPF